ncbi:MAG: NAD-dependent epimerase/dehydratase family protein [Cytophagales bacterium]|nr:NAD-dependent epimerase/dehydratase family protein [Cytophagales bacterium]
MGELGYDDDESIIPKLKPLNPYGKSKNDFDIWVLEQATQPPLQPSSKSSPPRIGEPGNRRNGEGEAIHRFTDSSPPASSEGRLSGRAGIHRFGKQRWWEGFKVGGPPFWAGLKLFNVYGPNEYHKGRMASVIFHTFNQISETGKMKLFRSHNPQFRDGEQKRDFVYVKDVLEVCMFLMKKKQDSPPLGGRGVSLSGIYNLGTGQARTFIDLAKSTFKAMGKPENICYIDTPEDIRDKYQYFTQANMQKLRSTGYEVPFYSLEDGVGDYVKNYLMLKKYY